MATTICARIGRTQPGSLYKAPTVKGILLPPTFHEGANRIKIRIPDVYE